MDGFGFDYEFEIELLLEFQDGAALISLKKLL
jgi:hypothetical protein